MSKMTHAQLAGMAADAAALAKGHADRAGAVTPGPGQVAVTIRVERPDGQFAIAMRLMPANLPAAGLHDWADHQIRYGFIDAYRRAAELPS